LKKCLFDHFKWLDKFSNEFYEKLIEISKNDSFLKFTQEVIANKNKPVKKAKEELKMQGMTPFWFSKENCQDHISIVPEIINL